MAFTPPQLLTDRASLTEIPPPTTGTLGPLADPALDIWNVRYRQAVEYQEQGGFQDNWQRYWKWYRAFRAPLTQPYDWWRSNEVIPTVFKIIETLTPKEILGMFSQPDWFNVRGTEATDERWELAIEGLLHEQLEEMKIVPKVIEAKKYAKIMGHCWGKVTWKEEYEKRAVVQPELAVDPETGAPLSVAMKVTTVDELTADRPDFDWVPLDRMKADPTGKCRWYIEEMDTTLEELEAVNEALGIYDNLDKLVQASSTITNSRPYQEPQNTEGISQTTAEPRAPDSVALWLCWGWVPKKCRPADGAEWRLVVIANKSIKLRDVPAPTPDGRPPYFPIKDILVPGILYGESILRYIGPLQDQETRIANHRLDEVYLNIWGQYVYNRASGITNNDMLFQPGGAIGVTGNPNEVFALLPRKPMLPEAYMEGDYRGRQAEEVAGANDIAQGKAESSRPTTGDTQIRAAQGAQRVDAQILWDDQTFKKEILERVYKFLQMRMPAERVIRVVGADGMDYDVTLDLQSVQLPVDITINGGLLGISKEQRRTQFTDMIAMAASPVLGPWMKPDSILRDKFRNDGVRATSRYVKTLDEMLMEQGMGMAPDPGSLGSGVDTGGGMDDGSGAFGATGPMTTGNPVQAQPGGAFA